MRGNRSEDVTTDDTRHCLHLLYMEKPWKGTIPERKGMGKLVFLSLKRRWRMLQPCLAHNSPLGGYTTSYSGTPKFPGRSGRRGDGKQTDRQIDRRTDRQQRVLLTSDVCLQWGHTEMFKMLQERSVMEECKENLDEQRNNTGW